MNENDRRRLAWAYLSRVVEGPNAHVQALLNAGHDVERIVWGIKHREEWIGEGLLRQTRSRWDWERSAEDLAAVSALGGRLVTPDDREWPHAEFDHAFGFAQSGKSEHARTYQEDAVQPHALWVRGGMLASLCAHSVGVVGTRAISRYGMEATRLLVSGLVEHHWVIVSGGALGVDTVAHEQVIASGGATVVVSACGLDRVYPARNAGLFDRILASGGALVSEYPPGVAPARHRFLTRNRLVAALSQGVVVMEAGWRSGALNTLTWASGLGRVAMAVPGPITHINSLGCHERIKDGRAQLVASADDVRALLGAVGALDSAEQYELQFAASPIQGLSRSEMRVFDALPAESSADETGLDAESVAQESGLPFPLTVHVLVDLAKRGLVVREGVMWRRG